MGIKTFTTAELQAAGASPGAIATFEAFEPTGVIQVTPAAFIKYEPTGIDLYKIAQAAIPPAAWAAFIVADDALKAQLAVDKKAAEDLMQSTVLNALLAIKPAVNSVVSTLTSDYASLLDQPAVVLQWGNNPDVIRTPMRNANTSLELAIGAYQTAVGNASNTLHQTTSALSQQYLVDRRQAICDIITALPDPE